MAQKVLWRAAAFCIMLGSGPIAVHAGAVELPFHGFAELAVGSRVVGNDLKEDDFLLGEARVQLEIGHYSDLAELNFKSDFFYDGVTEEADLDVREAFVFLLPADWVEIKAGRQVLTWGTGDYLFLNDLFPKDWVSFFTGREDSYLKAPSTAAKLSLFPGAFDLDIVWTPIFEPDRYIDGERITFFSPLTGGPTDVGADANKPGRSFQNSEWSVRVSRNIRGLELALYGYKGYYHQPLGFTPSTGQAWFPELAAWGLSLRGTFLGGIGNVEAAWYDSLDDRNGDDPMIENGQVRGLAGYTVEVASEFTLGLQYYIEWMTDHDRYLQGLPDSRFARDEDRHVITLSLTKLLLMQNLRMSVFAYYSPSDNDAYIRPVVHYKWTDNVSLSAGANLFVGEEDHTFFGQFEDNSNVYARVRYSF